MNKLSPPPQDAPMNVQLAWHIYIASRDEYLSLTGQEEPSDNEVLRKSAAYHIGYEEGSGAAYDYCIARAARSLAARSLAEARARTESAPDGEFFKQCREKRGLTLKEVSALSGYGVATINGLELAGNGSTRLRAKLREIYATTPPLA